MPASPSVHADGRGKWRRRKSEPLLNRRLKNDDEEEEDNGPNAEGEDDVVRGDDPHYGAVPSQETEVLADGGDRISHFPPVVKRTVNRPHSSVTAIVALERDNLRGDRRGQLHNSVLLENVSYGQLQALSTVPANSAALDQEKDNSRSSSCVERLPAIMEARGVVKRFADRAHVVPMHSDWFSPSRLHRLERQAVPHFFSRKSPEYTPEKYMECRNYIIAKYMENPEKRLTIADCQGLVPNVDNDDLTRILQFLDHWGIINYCAVANHENSNAEFCLKENPNGEIELLTAALQSMDSLIKFEKPSCKLKAMNVYSSLSSPSDDASELDNEIREQLSKNHCYYCSKLVCTLYYQSQKEVDVLLCSNCFHEGRFVAGHSSLDFTRVDSMDNHVDQDADHWTDQETLLLLEATEIYNENWDAISDHVGSKSKAECILHFLRLPMDGGLLENFEVPGTTISSVISNKDDQERLHPVLIGNSRGSYLPDDDFEGRFPFANYANPVMSLVAFLASTVGPRVASACAHAALAVLSEDGDSSGGMDGRNNRGRIQDREGGSHEEIAKSVQQKEESSIPAPRGLNEAEVAPLSAEKVQAAAKVGLAAAATKAKLFADHEEREIQRLSANIINHRFKRLELKLKLFSELETFLVKECDQVEKVRQRFSAERARTMSARAGSGGVASSASLPGIGFRMVNTSASNSGEQIMSASPSQPGISGYSTPSVHPQMSFMPRQPSPMYGLRPRLPLTAIQSSTSAPSPGILFNSPGNSQHAVNHSMFRPGGSRTSSGLG